MFSMHNNQHMHSLHLHFYLISIKTASVVSLSDAVAASAPLFEKLWCNGQTQKTKQMQHKSGTPMHLLSHNTQTIIA